MKSLIHSGTIITDQESFAGDVLISGEKIEKVFRSPVSPIVQNRSEINGIDASGCYILPGGVDPHTHFDLPMFDTVSSDDHYTGMKAAAFGGTTTVIDFIPLDFPSIKESVRTWVRKAERKAAVDYAFHMNMTRFDLDLETEIEWLVDFGITSLKVFTAYNNRLRLQDQEIKRVLELSQEHGMVTLLHAEDGDEIEKLVHMAHLAGGKSPIWHAITRPPEGTARAFERIAKLADQTKALLYLVHMNTKGEVEVLRELRKHSNRIIGETCPQYLFFTDEKLKDEDGAKWVCSPPLRQEKDNQELWEGLADGTIQTIGTDHCPFFYDGTETIVYEGEEIAIPGKELGKNDFTKIPNGLPGVGDRIPVMWTFGVGKGLISPNQFVALTSTNPAKIFGLYPQKGTIQPGSDADIVILDPNKELTYGVNIAKHRTDHNLYEGWRLKGFPVKVFLRGEMIVNDGQWLGRKGMGEFLKRSPAYKV